MAFGEKSAKVMNLPGSQFTIFFGVDKYGNCVIASEDTILSSLNKAMLSSKTNSKSYIESIYNGSTSIGKQNLIENVQIGPSGTSVSN